MDQETQRKIADPTLQIWLVWSNEHLAWWRPGRSGYTMNYNEAGRYTLVEAVGICNEANSVYFKRDTSAAPNETIHLEIK